uniref:Uncharacterized protein n=1 Tax=Oryza nivara TaxID=4536 RepID=A0A0E0IZN1_ORYNI
MAVRRGCCSPAAVTAVARRRPARRRKRRSIAQQGEAAHKIECWLALARVLVLGVLVIVVVHAAANVAGSSHSPPLTRPSPSRVLLHGGRWSTSPAKRAASDGGDFDDGRRARPRWLRWQRRRRRQQRETVVASTTIDEPGGSGFDGGSGGCGQAAASSFDSGRWRAALRCECRHRVSVAPTDGEGNGSLALPHEASEAGSSGRPAGARRPPPLPLREGVASLADNDNEDEEEEEAAWRGAAGPACTCPAPTDEEEEEEEEEEAAGRGTAGPARTRTGRINTVPSAADEEAAAARSGAAGPACTPCRRRWILDR